MDNREHILQTALSLFAARGYDAVGVQEIAESSGVTKPTMYHYFGSKQGLLSAMLEEKHTPLYRAVQEACNYQGDLPLTLEKITRAYFDFASLNPEYYRLLLALVFAPRDSEAHRMASGRFEEEHRLVENVFQTAVREHGNMQGRHRLLATTFIGMINTCIGLWLNSYAELDNALVYRVLHQFQHGIYS